MLNFLKTMKYVRVDDFMRHGLDSDDGEEIDGQVVINGEKRKKKKKSRKSDGIKEESLKQESSVASDHKKTLEKLREKDPDFYKFLQEEDAELLKFDLSDSDDTKNDNEIIDDVKDIVNNVKEIDQAENGKQLVTISHIHKWKRSLEHNPNLSVIRLVVRSFVAAAERAGADVENTEFIVEDSQIFDNVIRLCFNQLTSVWLNLIKPVVGKANHAEKPKIHGHKNPGTKFCNWKRYKSELRLYLATLNKLFPELQDDDVVKVTIRHVGQLTEFYLAFPKLAKVMLKHLIRVWSRRTEECKMLSFLNITKMIREDQDMFGIALKGMYLAYVQNCKLITRETWPNINLMQTSFGELCLMDPQTAYQFAFVYIRQTAIHLRNATIAKKKDLVQAVYNWQFVQCLYLWSKVLAMVFKSDHPLTKPLKELCYPLVQIITGCARLMPSARYYSLRFHCVRALLRLQAATGTFIPIMSLITEVLDQTEVFNKRHSRQTVKPVMFDCLLKASKSQMAENGFKDTTIESVSELILETLYLNANSLTFPELVLPAINKMKYFVKRCKVANYCREIRGLIEKIEEQRLFIENERRKFAVDLCDPDSVMEVEMQLQKIDSPLISFYHSSKKLRQREKVVAEKRENEDGVESDSDDGESESEMEDSDSNDEKGKKRKRNIKNNEKNVVKKPKVDIEIPVASDDVIEDLILSDDD